MAGFGLGPSSKSEKSLRSAPPPSSLSEFGSHPEKEDFTETYRTNRASSSAASGTSTGGMS